MVTHPSFVHQAPIVILAFELLVLGVISRGYVILPFPFPRVSLLLLFLLFPLLLAALACTFLLVLFGCSSGF
jgi:hypothetical protein